MSTSPHSTRAGRRPLTGSFLGEANPLLVRELRQSLRLPRLPWTIAAVITVIGLGMIAVGSLSSRPPAEVGAGLFQVYVTVLILFVCLVGPATAASAVAAEREGKTLEPLLLTSLSAADVARGKFLAAYTSLGLQLLALLPLSAIPLLFGGVASSELLVACVVVSLIAAVAVAFGLAVASRAQTLRGALAVSILLPAAGTPVALMILTWIGEMVGKSRWAIADRGPVWWTSAYTLVPFGLEYVVWLLVWPAVLLGVPFWLYRTLAAVNLAGPSEDHSTGPKRWMVGTTFILAATFFITIFRFDVRRVPVATLTFFLLTACFLFFSALLVCAEPIYPTRLVRARWRRLETNAVIRAFGPGVTRTALLQIVSAIVLVGVLYLGTSLATTSSGLRNVLGIASTSSPHTSLGTGLGVIAAYTLGFNAFLVGLGTFLRTRPAGSPTTARTWLIAVSTILLVVPLLISMLASVDREGLSVIACPSPAFGFIAFVAILDARLGAESLTLGSLLVSLVYFTAGVTLLSIGGERARRAARAEAKAFEREKDKLDIESDEDTEEDDDVLAPPPPPGH